MKNYHNFFKALILSVFMMFTGLVLAAQTNDKTVADIKTELISNMEKDGYLSKKMANEVAQKYIKEEDKTTVNKPTSSEKTEAQAVKENVKWSDYLSWVNFIKTVALIAFLWMVRGIIALIMVGLWGFIAAVPVIVYQLVFLSLGVFGIVKPEFVWESQSIYVALFSAFFNVITVGWIVATHEKLQKFIERIFNLGIPVSCVASFYGMIYFGILALVYHSSIFGFFAAVCLSGIFSFGIYYMPGVLFLDFKENMMGAVVFGHLVVLAVYTVLFKHIPEYTAYFDVGIQYYCTIALGVGLLVAASPFYKRESALGYAVIFIALACFASYGYFFYDMKVIASIIFCFFTLFVLEWVGYIGYNAGAILGSGLIGGSLYGLALLLETYGSMVVLSMNQ